jgi:hypothetical protein
VSEHAELRGDLDRIAHQVSGELRRARTQRALLRCAECELMWLPAVPALIALVQLARWALGGDAPGFSFLWVLALTLAIGTALLVWRAARALAAPGDPRDALAVADRELGSEDRLLTAYEFLGTSARTPFMEAALLDAEEFGRRVRGRSVRLVTRTPRPGLRAGAVLALTLVAMLASVWLGGLQPLTPSRASNTQLADLETAGIAPAALEQELADRPAPPPAEPPRGEARAASHEREKTTEVLERSAEISEGTKPSEGKTGSGRSADAENASGASESRGAPSNQAQSTKPAAKKPKAADKQPKKKKSDAPPPDTRKRNEEDSGSTAGRGSSKGSNKNPAASSWSSKDQVTTEDDQEIEDDEDTEDEEEEQEARGGVQPSLRDRRPPVSRDLRIGFGNNPDPDANGRGGPSQMKKSRGTASLVLGVPIPDRVKGQPNPGKTKITQERIEPKAEESERLSAEARLPRAAPAGYSSRPELTPWMRELVRTYFLNLRKQTKARS